MASVDQTDNSIKPGVSYHYNSSTTTSNPKAITETIIGGDKSVTDEKEWRRVLWKIDLWIQPILFLLVLVTAIDTSNIGNAEVAGLTKDIDSTDDQFNWALSANYIGTLVTEIPSNMILKKFGARTWFPTIALLCGTVLAATSAVKTGTQLIIARFFIGLVAGGLPPGIVYYASLWFPRSDISSRLAIFFIGANNIAGAVGGLLAFGIVQMDGLGGLHGWQWLFIIEAIPLILLGFILIFILPEGPHDAKFLNETERKVVMDRLSADNGRSTESEEEEIGKFSWKQFFEVFKDWKTYCFILLAFCSLTIIRCIRMFLPLIIKGLGAFDDVTTQGMTTPPYLAGFIATIFYSKSSDYFKERGFHIAIMAIIILVGFVILIALRFAAPAGLYVCICIMVAAITCVATLRSAWISNNYGGTSKRAVAIAVILAAGAVGSPFGGQFYRADDAPHYVRGHSIMVGLAGCLLIVSLVTKFGLYRANKKRDQMTDEEKKAVIMKADGKDLSDEHPDYRYIL
ncbi:major facilitator superfamily domain-containing protein [Phascolomyces articulosus]|uniref:Major facilitator superfamily domain-containing protein n=1 Tax=Phascolomyces articulosus TaxID=60185 RepID=A0AAD5K341_9FUNG|nr:major facilitator superfamily domain-containing protein [Phascolomyces articulosus]